MNNPLFEDMNHEYQEFLKNDETKPPAAISENIFRTIYHDLHPNAWEVFAKLSLIHVVSALVTLSICPQFGIRIFGNGMGLMHYFMHFGPFVCAIFCGSFFVGTTMIIANIWLTAEELGTLRKQRFLQLTALLLLSLGAFIMADADILFGFTAFWLFGSLVSGISMMELGWRIRRPL